MSAGAKNTCPACGTPLGAETVDGFCIDCLFREGAAARQKSPLSGPTTRPHKLGNYEILSEIGRGAMGRVYRARQSRPERLVALKVISAWEIGSASHVERFRIEAEAVAKLDHPQIVPIYEVGEEEEWNYFSMRLIEGETLSRRLARGKLSGSEAAQLLAKVARAIQHAHERGILHRDIKPGNILLDRYSEPHVADFGLAKFTENESDLTLTSIALGTPAYMAPEQATGGAKDATTAADIYSLGAVLYEALTGRPPFTGATPLEAMKRAAEEAPPPLPGVPRDLQVICLKCLAKAPADRYGSAASLAEDLDRFSRGEPVSAVPLTPLQSAWRWAQRRPQIAALLGFTVLSVLSSLVGITWQWRKAERARRGEELALEKANSTIVDLYINSGLTAARDESTRAALWFAKAAEASADPNQRRENLTRQAAWRTESSLPVRAFPSTVGQILRLSWNPTQTALLGFTWDLRTEIWDVAGERPWEPMRGLALESATWASHGSWLIASSSGCILQLDYPSGREFARTRCDTRYPMLAVSSDDTTVVIGGLSPFLWNLASNTTARLPRLSVPPRLLQFSPDGHLVMICAGNKVGVCSVGAPQDYLFPPVSSPEPVIPGFLGNTTFYTSTGLDLVQVLDADTGSMSETYTNKANAGESIPFFGSRDGRYIVNSMAPVIKRPEGYMQIPMHGNRIEQADFSPDGSLLATACYDSIVRLVALESGKTRPIGWHQEGAQAVAISPDQRLIATSQAGENLVRIWRLGGPPKPREIPIRGLSSFRLSPNGRFLLLTGNTGAYATLESTRVYSLPAVAPAGPEIPVDGLLMDGDFAPDGSWISLISADRNNRANGNFAANGGSGRLEFRNYQTGEPIGAPLLLPSEPRGMAVHPSGRWVAVFTAKRELLEIEVGTRRLRTVYATTNSYAPGDVYPNGRCRYSPDGRFLAAWAMRMPPIVWDRDAELFLPIGTNQVTDAEFKRELFASVSMQSAIEFLQATTRTTARTALQDNDWLFFGRFNTDATLFLTGGRGKTAHVWDWRRGSLYSPAFRHDSELFAGAFIPKTDAVATGGLDRSVQIWNSHTALPLRPKVEADSYILSLATTPDGRTLICGDERILLYDIDALLPRPTLSVADALLLAEIEAAAQIQNAALEPLTAADWMRKWRKFRELHPEWHAGPL